MAPHSSTFAWKIPWTEEPGRLQSMGSLESDTTERLHFHFSLSCIGKGNGNPLQCSCLENPRDGGAWWAAVYGVAQSQTRLKRLSRSSSRFVIAFLPSFSFIAWVSLVAQLLKNLPAMWETWIRSLGWEDPLEGNSYPLQYFGLENSMDCLVHGVAESDMTEQLSLSFHAFITY